VCPFSWSFLLWLDGGLNVSDLHEQLKNDAHFKCHFFEFLEDIIHHHLPDIKVHIDPSFEPHVERPSHSPLSLMDAMHELNSWESAFVTQIKTCGGALQWHACKAMCHKYNNGDCC
jgi:hypothetical protein